MSERTETKTQRLAAQAPRIRVGAILAIVAAAVLVAFLILRDDNAQKATGGSAQPGSVAVSVGELESRAARADHPIYWTGPLKNRTYELTETPDGRIYIRYLPGEATIGVRRPYLMIGTYRLPNAFDATRAMSKLEGARTIRIGNGGVAFYAQDHPTSVYLGYPGSDFQIEVFHPNARIARRLVTTGKVRPVRGLR